MSTCQVVAEMTSFGNMPQTSAARHGGRAVSEWIGVAIALVSSCLGGTAAAITRYLVGNADPITLAILRWGIGFACLMAAASRLAGGGRAGAVFLRTVLRALQHRDRLYDRGSRQPRAGDVAAAHNA